MKRGNNKSRSDLFANKICHYSKEIGGEWRIRNTNIKHPDILKDGIGGERDRVHLRSMGFVSLFEWDYIDNKLYAKFYEDK